MEHASLVKTQDIAHEPKKKNQHTHESTRKKLEKKTRMKSIFVTYAERGCMNSGVYRGGMLKPCKTTRFLFKIRPEIPTHRAVLHYDELLKRVVWFIYFCPDLLACQLNAEVRDRDINRHTTGRGTKCHSKREKKKKKKSLGVP